MKRPTEQAGCALRAGDGLAVAVHRREPGAFERLIETFEASLHNYACRLLDNAFDAQEVVQDAFIRAHRALTRQYDEARCIDLALRPWLFRIARNLCFNKRRSKSGFKEEPLSSYDDGRIGPIVTPAHSELEAREEAATLERAIDTLPHEYREIVVLRFFEEMSYADIAGTVGTTEAALRGKVFRSLKLLRTALEKEGVAHAM
jgi:RNA polymerase sigma-70 factor (ECF subfamily)